MDRWIRLEKASEALPKEYRHIGLWISFLNSPKCRCRPDHIPDIAQLDNKDVPDLFRYFKMVLEKHYVSVTAQLHKKRTAAILQFLLKCTCKIACPIHLKMLSVSCGEYSGTISLSFLFIDCESWSSDSSFNCLSPDFSQSRSSAGLFT